MKHLSALATSLGVIAGLLHPDANAACTKDWLYGTWRSHPEKSIENMSSQGTVLQGPQRERMKAIFGTHVHQIDKRSFSVRIEQPNQATTQTRSEYSLKSCTESTVTLGFRRKGWTDLVLYRTEGCYMVRSQDNFEYFCRSQ